MEILFHKKLASFDNKGFILDNCKLLQSRLLLQVHGNSSDVLKTRATRRTFMTENGINVQ